MLARIKNDQTKTSLYLSHTCRYVSPRKSGSRRSISAKIQPTLQMSIGYPYSAASMISGDLYQRVTTYSVSSAVSSSSAELTPRDRPKSHSLRSQFCRHKGGGGRGKRLKLPEAIFDPVVRNHQVVIVQSLRTRAQHDMVLLVPCDSCAL